MINFIVTQSLYLISSACTTKEYSPILIISSSLNSLLCILLLPVTIRLAGQLIAQVFKYRYIVNNCIKDCDDDSKVITAYHQHFQIFLGIVLCMFGFCIFNPIFLIYSSVSVITQEWDKQYLIGYVAGAISQSFQEGIVLFGVTLLLQIANYFKGKKVQLIIITILIIARMGYLFIFQFTQVILQFIDLSLSQKLPYSFDPYYINSYLISYYSIVLFLNVIDTITRVFTIFAFMRMCIIIVHKRIIEFITDLNTNFLEWQRYEDKIRAFKLMKIAAWGTYSLTIINFLDTLSCLIIILLIQLQILPNSDSNSTLYITLYVSLGGLIFVSILSILPSILYSIFLVTAWLVFRHRTRVRYSGFRTSDVTREQLIPNEPIFTNQDHLHQTYYKHKNKIHLISYVILIISASSLFSLFLTPLMIQHSRQPITLKPGDYQMFNNTFKDCELFSYYLGKDSNPFTYLNPSSENKDCSTNLKGLKLQKQFKQSLTTQYNISNFIYRIKTWIPQNSTISKYCNYSLNGTVVKGELSVVLYFPSETPHYHIGYTSINNNYCLIVTNTTINSSQGLFNIETSGMYDISILDSYYYETCILNITRSIDRIIGDRVLYSHFSQGTNIAELDGIIYEPTGDIAIYHYYESCQLNIVCYYNPVWSILFGMSVFLVTVLIQVLLLYCIHRI